MARTDTLGHFLTDVADAIREKKGTSDTIQASDFDTEIENLPSGGGDLDEYFTETIPNGNASVAGYVKTIKKLPAYTTTSTTYQNMFSYYQGTSLDLSNFNTSNVYSMSTMFSYCGNLSSLDLSNFNTASLTNVTSMFLGCGSLTELDIHNFDITVSSINAMFMSCVSIKRIDARNVKLTATNANTSNAFSYCTRLEYLDIRSMSFDGVTRYTDMFGSTTANRVPAECKIIVKDDTQKTWITSKFSWLTNVKTVAEYEAEQSE